MTKNRYQWGLCEYVILRVQNETRWVARVLAGTFLSHMAGRSLPFQCFHSPVRFLFVSFPSHGKSADLCSWAWLRPWLSTPGSAFTSLVVGSGLHWACITHCTTICAILTIDDLEKKKREACRSRSCPWLLTGITEQGNGKLSTSFLGGIPRCSRLCPWENGRNACVKHCFVVHLRSLSTHSSICFYFAVAVLLLASQVFNFFSSDRHFSSDKFSFGSSWPFFFISSLSSLFFCSVFQGTPSHSSCIIWQSLQNISTSVRRQAMEWESFLFACRAAGTSEHVHAAGLDHFESSDRISACIVKEHWEAWWKFSACHPVRDAMRDKT